MDINNKKPLVITLNGGLGNQLFMLFAGISKAIDENRDYLIYLEYNKRPYYFDNIMQHIRNKVINYNNIEINAVTVYTEPFHHYKQIPDNYDVIKGYFQSPKYFYNNFNKIMNELNIYYYKNIYNINLKSIAIHIRLGDFIELQHIHNRIVSFVYYLKAIRYLKESLEDFDEYTFIIFGEKGNNDIIDDFIKQIDHNLNISFNYIKIYDRYPNNTKDYAEFFYMSNCNHIIMGNSTFSWFASYINNNQDKQIIYPHRSKWFADAIINNYNLDDLFPNNWIEIDY